MNHYMVDVRSNIIMKMVIIGSVDKKWTI
jgi:hypothetical protein